jgi:creatinine amidohydrolase
MLFERLKWGELKDTSSKVFLVPLGSLEQHGPHLPLGTDTWIVSEVARRVEQKAPGEFILLPTLWLGHSPHHQHFGCASIDMRPYMDMIGGLCRSLVASGARKILLLNGHGGNDVPAKAALREVKDYLHSSPDVYIAFASYWNLAASKLTDLRESPRGGMGHACELETSILLSTAPESVDETATAPDGLKAESKWLQHDMLAGQPYFLVNDFREITASGVFGMPQYASAEKGERFLHAIVDSVLEFVRDFATWTYQQDARSIP